MRLKWYRGAWYAVWTDGGRTRRAALRTKDRQIAEQRIADLRRAPSGESVQQIYTAYAKDLRARGKDAERAENAWKALSATFGSLRPDQVTRDLCRSYILERRLLGRKDGTIGKELGCLRAALRWQDQHTPATIDMPSRPPPRDRRLTREEYRNLRRAAKRTLHVYVFVVLGLTTAARKQAILDLTWNRVDFERGQIRLYAGGEGKGRAVVPMTRHARRTLLLAKRMATTPYVIEYAGRKVGSIKRGFAAACREAGLDDVTPHVLRHTAAVWMAERGIPMSEIAQYLGHSDSRLTERVYARYSPSYLRRAAAALE